MRSSTSPQTRLGAVLIACASLAAGCGGDSVSEAPITLGVIQNLVVDPADRSLVIATTTGVHRLAPEDKDVSRLGRVGWDVRGLAMLRPNVLLASGNSTPQDPQPPRLGLQRSDDGGKTWRGISLVGKAAFDTIQVSGSSIYGVERARGRVLVSRDSGRTWRRLNTSGAVVDLEVDPANPQRLVVSRQFDAFLSRDGGRHWRELGTGPMLFAWPDSRHLYGVTSRGEVWRTANGGLAWTISGDLSLTPTVFAAGGQRELFAALPDGSILRSPSAGDGWDVRLTAAT